MLFRQIFSFIALHNSRLSQVLQRLKNIFFYSLKIIESSRKLKGDLNLVISSCLFDASWYRANNPDLVQLKEVELLYHYLHYGGFEGRDPSPNFCSQWYLDTYEDVKKAGVNPLVHYIKYGEKEGRMPIPDQRALQMPVSLFSHSTLSQYDKWIAANEPSPASLEIQRAKARNLGYKPLISVVMPVWNTPPKYLDETIRSVVDQTYDQWEFCIVDGNSNAETKNILLSWAKKDHRIRIKFLDENMGIAANSNEALLLAQGEFIAFLDHDDLLAPFALFEIVYWLQFDKNVDVIYSDEDKTDEERRRFDAFFKPDFSPDYLRSVNYMPHFLVVRKFLGDQVAWFREGYDGAQDYDLILRLVEKARVIAHIPKVLYHWRVWAESTAGGANAKPYANESGKKALKGHLKRLGLSAQVKDGYIPTLYWVDYRITVTPLISIIILNQDQIADLERCIDSILQKTTYPNFEIILVENGSKALETFKLYERFKQDARIRIMKWDGTFNVSRINNWAAMQASGEVFLFLSNNAQIINKNWLEQMLQFAIRPDVGAVGAKLYDSDGKILHGGIIIGVNGVAGYSHRNFPQNDSGYFFQLVLPHNVSAVTGRCLMIQKKVFQEVNGFDENYSHVFGDINLCLSVLEKGYLNVWTPYAELFQYESQGGGDENNEKQAGLREDVDRFKQKWSGFLRKGDSYYNPNLTLDTENFSINLNLVSGSSL